MVCVCNFESLRFLIRFVEIKFQFSNRCVFDKVCNENRRFE
jgi:hypothetical protein